MNTFFPLFCIYIIEKNHKADINSTGFISQSSGVTLLAKSCAKLHFYARVQISQFLEISLVHDLSCPCISFVTMEARVFKVLHKIDLSFNMICRVFNLASVVLFRSFCGPEKMNAKNSHHFWRFLTLILNIFLRTHNFLEHFEQKLCRFISSIQIYSVQLYGPALFVRILSGVSLCIIYF